MTTEQDTARDQAARQLESNRHLLAWRDHTQECDGEACDLGAEDWIELAKTIKDDWHDIEAAQEAIEENALDVQVNHGWSAPSDDPGDPERFLILLCTGGPAVRIMGELDEYGTPTRAWLEYQDWGTPWTFYPSGLGDELLNFSAQFYFGG